MGLLDKVERGIEKAVRGVFSTGSKAQVEPVEIASRLRREVDHKALTVAAGRTLAPNVFDVQLSDDDFKRAQEWGTPLAEELCDVVINHVRSQGYTLQGSVRISFRRDSELRAGDFEIASSTEKSKGNGSTQPSRPTVPAAPSRQPVRLQPVLDIDGQRYSLNAPSIVLGRSSEADIHRRGHRSFPPAPGNPHCQRCHQRRGPGLHERQLRQRAAGLGQHRTYRRLHHHDGTDKDHLPPASRQPWWPRMSDLTITALRFGFLLLLWVLIFSIVSAMRRDLMVGRKAASGAPTAREVRKNPDLAEAPPQPVKQQARQLVVVEGPLKGTTLPLAASPILLGRAQEATLVLEDDYASGRHARLFPQGSRWFIEDLGSTNGTYLADQQLTRALPVEPGVPVRIGKTVIELRP